MTVVVIILSVYLALVSIAWGGYHFQDYRFNFIDFLQFAFIYITLPIWAIYWLSLQVGYFIKKLWKKCRKLLTRHK